MRGKSRSNPARSETQTTGANRHRALIVGGISVAVLAVASSASAATFTPTSADFGRVVIGHKSAPVTFTLTKGSDEGRFETAPGPGGGFAVGNKLGFADVFALGTCHTTPVLTASTPSCTITVYFAPESYGRYTGQVLGNDLSPDPIVQLTGVGLIPRKFSVCQKGSHKKIKRWCQK